MAEKVFKAQLSKWIIGMYWLILFFLVAMTIVLFPVVSIEPPAYLFFTGIMAFVSLMFLLMILRAYRMKYAVTEKELVIHGVFFKSKVKRSDIKSLKRTMIPMGFKLYGASFLGGWYYIPGVGKAKVAMANFKDGVLITTKQGKNYLITPENPDSFIKAVK
jgi:hypothetical protein